MAELVIKLVNGELAGKTAQEIAKQIRDAGTAARKAEVGTKAWVDAHAKLDKAKDLQQDLRKQVEATTAASNALKNSVPTIESLAKNVRDAGIELSKATIGTEAFVKAQKKLEAAKAQQKLITEQIQETTSASDKLRAAWNALPGSQFFNQIGESFGLMKGGVGGLVTQFGVLRTAIAATGLGLLVLLLGSLVSYFTTTQEGMDKVTKVTRPLAAIFERLKGVLQELGEKVFDRLSAAIDNPKQAFIDLGNAIKENIINRFQALALFGPAIAKIFSGDLSGGFKDLGNAAIQLGTGVENVIDKVGDAAKNLTAFVNEAVTQGTRLDELQKQIERHEINQIKRSKELDLIVKQQKFILEDQTKSYDERRAAAELAMAAQTELLQGELSLLDKRIAKMQLEHSLNDTSREQEKELAELQAQRFEKEAQMTDQRIEFRNKVNEVNKAQAAEEEATIKNIEALRLEAMKEGMEKEIEQIKLETEEKIEALTGSAEQILEQEKLLLEIRQNEINALLDSYAEEQAEKDKKATGAEHKALMEDYDKKIDEAERYEDAKRQIEQESFDAAQDISGSFIDLLSTDEKSRKKHAAAIKAIQVGSVTASLASEIQAIWEHANKSQANALFPGAATIIAVVKTVAAAARAGAALGKINSAKFAMGGLLRGPKHSQGGIPGVITTTGQAIEMEGDEFILSGKATRAIGANNLIRMNNYLTRKMAMGGPVNPFPDRAPVSSGTSTGSTTPVLPETTELIEEVRGLRADVAQWQRTLRVVNVVTDTEAGIKTINSIKAEADV